MTKCHIPCATCPWRVDKTRSDIPHYDQAKADKLLDTVGQGDAFRPIMACHKSSDRKMIPCKGYLAQEGWSNINVRLLLIQNNIPNPTDVAQTCKHRGITLEPNYHAVLRKLSI